MNDKIAQLLSQYFTGCEDQADTRNYDVRTDDGYQNAIELLAELRKTYDNSILKDLFDPVFGQSSFTDFLDNLYTVVVKTHTEAVKKRKENESKTDFEKLSESDRTNVTNAVNKYLEKYANASEETKNLSADILKDYTAWVILRTRGEK